MYDFEDISFGLFLSKYPVSTRIIISLYSLIFSRKNWDKLFDKCFCANVLFLILPGVVGLDFFKSEFVVVVLVCILNPAHFYW